MLDLPFIFIGITICISKGNKFHTCFDYIQFAIQKQGTFPLHVIFAVFTKFRTVVSPFYQASQPSSAQFYQNCEKHFSLRAKSAILKL